MTISVALVYGTHAALIAALRDDDRFETTIISVVQYANLVATVENTFGFHPDVRLRSPHTVSEQLRRSAPDLVVVHGKTTTAVNAALAARQQRIPIVHLEAGSRSGGVFSPRAAETNRRMIGQIASFHLAPTQRARENLLAEGITDERIVVTGDTVIDALLMTVRRTACFSSKAVSAGFDPCKRTILFTTHRRESWERGLSDTARALNSVLQQRSDTMVFVPLQTNPIVREAILPHLGRHPRAVISPPLGYPDFCLAMDRAYCIVTDSGRVQQEAPSLNTPVLVTRATAERAEVLATGAARLVGTECAYVSDSVLRLLDNPREYAHMRSGQNPYGDGCAAARCVEALRCWVTTSDGSRS